MRVLFWPHIGGSETAGTMLIDALRPRSVDMSLRARERAKTFSAARYAGAR